MLETEEYNPRDLADVTATAGTYVTFDLGGQVLGVQVHHVREILDTVSISRLPNTPHEIEGVVDIRGESIPIVDMGSRLGLPRQDDCEETRIIVFEIVADGAVRPVGVLADRVRDVTQIWQEELESPPTVVGSNWDSELLGGFARHAGLLILLLNLDRVFGCGDVPSLDPAFM
ncbi:MAG: chemotaxis protein CheW [Paracoccaceae bacterium]